MPIIPFSAYLELTYNCNHSCRFCSRPWLRHSELYASELSLDEWKRVIGLLGTWGVRSITFTGGEPLLKEGFMELVEAAVNSQCFNSISVFTNGMQLSDELLVFFANHHIHLAVSLPGVFSFRYLTGSASTSHKLMERVSQAKKLGMYIQVSIVVNKKNFWEIPLSALLAYWYGASSIQIGPCMPHGMAHYSHDQCLNDKQFIRLTKVALILDRLLKVPISFSYERQCFCSEQKVSSTENHDLHCRAGKDFFVVGPAGGIRKCPHTFQNLSSILATDHATFNGLWES